MAFTNSTPVKQSTNMELVEKVIDLIKNLDASLQLRSNSAIVHLNPFCLILL